MKQVVRTLILICLLTGSVSSALGQTRKTVHPPLTDSDSGVASPPYFEIEADLLRLEKQFPQLAQRIVYGKSIQGRNLNVIRIGFSSATRSRISRPAVLITGATHGNEYLNLEHKLPRLFLENSQKLLHFQRFVANGGVVYVVPVVNPDGYEMDQRENGNGVDLNRDYPILPLNRPGFTQIETRSLIDFLVRDTQRLGTKIKVAVEYHCCIGALLYPWSFKAKPLPPTDLKRFQSLAALLQKPFGKDYPFGTTPELLGYDAFGASKDFYYAAHGTLAYTFEGVYADEQSKLPQHVQMWESVFALLSGAL